MLCNKVNNKFVLWCAICELVRSWNDRYPKSGSITSPNLCMYDLIKTQDQLWFYCHRRCVVKFSHLENEIIFCLDNQNCKSFKSENSNPGLNGAVWSFRTVPTAEANKHQLQQHSVFTLQIFVFILQLLIQKSYQPINHLCRWYESNFLGIYVVIQVFLVDPSAWRHMSHWVTLAGDV